MPTPSTDLKFDPIGEHPNNLVSGLTFEVVAGENHLIEFEHGCFYLTDDLVVKDANDSEITDGRTLSAIETVGLEPVSESRRRIKAVIDTELTALTGKFVACALLFHDINDHGNFTFTGQFVGGEEGQTKTVARELLEELKKFDKDSNFKVDWNKIVHPREIDPIEHNHPITDITEVDKLTRHLKDLTTAVVNSQQLGTTSQNVRNELGFVRDALGEVARRVNQFEVYGDRGYGTFASELGNEIRDLRQTFVDNTDISEYIKILSDYGATTPGQLGGLLVKDLTYQDAHGQANFGKLDQLILGINQRLDKIEKKGTEAVGSIKMFMGQSGSIPEGWVSMNGQTLPRATYTELGKLYDTLTLYRDVAVEFYVGTNLLRVPDWRGRYPKHYENIKSAVVNNSGGLDFIYTPEGKVTFAKEIDESLTVEQKAALIGWIGYTAGKGLVITSGEIQLNKTLEDAIRNITAELYTNHMTTVGGYLTSSDERFDTKIWENIKGEDSGALGVFTNQHSSLYSYNTGRYPGSTLLMDASRVVPTAEENRPKTVITNFIMKVI